MLVSEFDYILPQELIAQHPVEPRDHSRLMVIDRQRQTVKGDRFHELPAYLEAGDLLVLNDTRVIPARLFARKEGDQGAKVEVFLLREVGLGTWESMVKPGKRVKPGARLNFKQGVTGEVLDLLPGGNRLIKFNGVTDFRDWLGRNGETPLPPYINERLGDPERYQTIYARQDGSVAAPTAGLHFTPELLEQLKAGGVKLGFLTLNIGLGTFRPVQSELVEEHLMHPEAYTLGSELVNLIKQTHQSGRRVIAVGTTVVRVLEAQAATNGQLQAGSGETAIFIYPGYRFKVIDALITNFHLPRSTLLMLVAAFAGHDFIMESYRLAVAERYRFFSFGDAMFII